jgi:hypothetical protein
MQLKDILIACSFDSAIASIQLQPVLKALPQQAILTWNGTEYCLDDHRVTTPLDLIQLLRSRAFQAALIFTQPHQSCYSLAYLCYLAGIPIRIGQSVEFAGGVLSQWIKPISDPVPAADYHLHLLKSCDLEF